MNLRDFHTAESRREALSAELGVGLVEVGSIPIDEAVVSKKHCENLVGAVVVPLGVAGPLTWQKVNGKGQMESYLPLATTEGALVASVSRGCKAISASGGATVDSYRLGASRGPVFAVANLMESNKLRVFLSEHFDDLYHVAQQTSSHIYLKKITSRGVGQYRFVRFVFDTQDAMGLNMVTIATDAIVKHITEKIGAQCLSISGNYCVDKKPSWMNFILGRGIEVWAEVVIQKDVLAETLKTTAQDVFDVWLSKCMMGSVMTGTIGANAHAANVIAAMFLATGQDMAHVIESGVVVTTAKAYENGDLYMSVFLPNLMVGTVGGGTGLATQKEALSIMGISGGDDGKNSMKLAEIMGAAVLAGEVSLLSSLSEGSLTRAHQRLGRGEAV